MQLDLNHIIQDKEPDLLKERRQVAKKIYQSYSQVQKTSNILPTSTIPQEDQKTHKFETTTISVEDSLMLLTEVSKGRTFKEVHDESDIFRSIGMKQMYNIFNSTLLKLSKTFLGVLPKNTCQLGGEEYKKTYFKSGSLLAYYNANGILMGDLFNKLMFMKKWLKKYSRYISEGYGSDYLPENVVTILSELPDYHRHICSLYEDSHLANQKPQKKVKSKQTCIQSLERQQQ